jgi:hypothetical protein
MTRPVPAIAAGVQLLYVPARPARTQRQHAREQLPRALRGGYRQRLRHCGTGLESGAEAADQPGESSSTGKSQKRAA